MNPDLLSLLLAHVERDSNMTYYVINKRGDLRTNTHSDGPNAVTWGVFPGKEIIQPTIVEAVSFMAWKVHELHILFCAHRLICSFFFRMKRSNWASNGRRCTTQIHPPANSSPTLWMLPSLSMSYTMISTIRTPSLNPSCWRVKNFKLQRRLSPSKPLQMG